MDFPDVVLSGEDGEQAGVGVVELNKDEDRDEYHTFICMRNSIKGNSFNLLVKTSRIHAKNFLVSECKHNFSLFSRKLHRAPLRLCSDFRQISFNGKAATQ